MVFAEGIADLMADLDLIDVNFRDELSGDLGAAMAAGIYPDEAFRAAGRGLGRALLAAVESKNIEVTFDAEWTSPSGTFALPVEPLRILSDAYTDSERARSATRRLAGFSERQVITERTEGSRLRGLDPIEQAILKGAGHATLGELVRNIGRGQSARSARAWIAADLLFTLGLLELGAEPAESLPPSPAADDAPPKRSSAKEYSELREKLQSFKEKRPLEILEVAATPRPGALTMEKVVESYRVVGARYHPDRYVKSNPKVGDLAARVFEKVTEAYEAIRHPGALEEEIARLEAASRGDIYVSEMDVQKARVFYRKAETATQRRNWSGALELINRSVELDPRSPEPRMLQILCRFVARELPPKETISALQNMPAITPRQEAERFLMVGRVMKLAGKDEKAVVRFRKVLELIPDHPEARREVWLYEKRKPDRGGAGLAGLFSRRS